MRCKLPMLSLGLVFGLALGCSNDLSRPSEVTTLRVLGVQADPAFPAPGEHPQLSMLYEDGKAQEGAAPRRVRIAWLAGCDNPAGDLYYNCAQAIAETGALLSDADLSAEHAPPTAAGLVGFGSTFTGSIAADAIARRPQPSGISHSYALSYVFFGVCAGELRREPDAAEGFPLGCYSEADGRKMGDADFVIGYFPLYIYDGLRNQNPVILGATVDGTSYGDPCVTAGDCPSHTSCGQRGSCIPELPACQASQRDDCPSYAFQPIVDATSVEPAFSAQVSDAHAPSELVWVDYFATAGSFETDAKIMNDPDIGLSASYADAWRAPKTPGEVRLWAVVHDNRGGSAWIEQDVLVRAF